MHDDDVISGVWSLIISAASLPLVTNRLLSSSISSLSPYTWAALAASGLIELVGVWWTVTAVSLLQAPTLVTMLR